MIPKGFAGDPIPDAPLKRETHAVTTSFDFSNDLSRRSANEDVARQFMLANIWNSSIDPTGWYKKKDFERC